MTALAFDQSRLPDLITHCRQRGWVITQDGVLDRFDVSIAGGPSQKWLARELWDLALQIAGWDPAPTVKDDPNWVDPYDFDFKGVEI